MNHTYTWPDVLSNSRSDLPSTLKSRLAGAGTLTAMAAVAESAVP
jgi:hypothetical protein